MVAGRLLSFWDGVIFWGYVSFERITKEEQKFKNSSRVDPWSISRESLLKARQLDVAFNSLTILHAKSCYIILELTIIVYQQFNIYIYIFLLCITWFYFHTSIYVNILCVYQIYILICLCTYIYSYSITVVSNVFRNQHVTPKWHRRCRNASFSRFQPQISNP